MMNYRKLSGENSLTDKEILNLIELICNAEGTEEEIDNHISLLEKSIPSSNISDLIFWPNINDGWFENAIPTAEEILKKAREYKPINL